MLLFMTSSSIIINAKNYNIIQVYSLLLLDVEEKLYVCTSRVGASVHRKRMQKSVFHQSCRMPFNLNTNLHELHTTQKLFSATVTRQWCCWWRRRRKLRNFSPSINTFVKFATTSFSLYKKFISTFFLHFLVLKLTARDNCKKLIGHRENFFLQ